MFGGEVVDDVGGLIEVAHQDGLRVAQGRVDDLPPAGVRQGFFERLAHPLDQLGIGGDEERARLRVVFGLGDQIEGGHVDVDVAGRHDRELGRTGQPVDADRAGHLAFGFGHVGVARTHDSVDAWDRFGAVGHRAHRLGATGLGDVGGARAHRGVQHGVGDGTVGLRRRAEHDLLDARHDRGHDGHAHRRRIHGTTPGHVAPHALERAHDLAEAHAVAFVGPSARQLARSQVLQAVDQGVERGTEIGGGVDARRP